MSRVELAFVHKEILTVTFGSGGGGYRPFAERTTDVDLHYEHPREETPMCAGLLGW